MQSTFEMADTYIYNIYIFIWAPRVFRAPHICVIWTRHLIEAIDIATADEMLTLHEGFYRPLAFSK